MPPPHEIAELSLGLIEARDGTKNFKVERIELANLAGHEGYRAEARFFDAQGLPKRLHAYGVMIGEYVCEFRYVGAEKVYFERYLPVFEEIIASLRVARR